jgi:glycosyltransferase involved in cell wall biosynthesis
MQLQPAGKWSQFFGALAQQCNLVDVIQPKLGVVSQGVTLARNFHPRIPTWKARAGFNQERVRKLTEQVQRGLEPHMGEYDLIMQLQTLCAPRFERAGSPYAIYTDNTMALTQRVFPSGAPISTSAAQRWIEFEAQVCRSAKVVFTLSEFARRSVIDDYGCSPDSVAAVGGGTNQLTASIAGKSYGTARALFVGLAFERKGGSVLLEAWPIVRSHVPAAELIITGPKRQPVKELPAGVEWVGRADRTRLAQLYQSASVFVLPSLFEPWGFVFFEAMGYGLPCIGTSCCAMPEIIEDGVTGRLVPPRDPESLAAALVELLADPDKAAAMGHAAHTHALHGNTWKDVLDRMFAHPALAAISQ